jgi:hypothetical protein
MDSSHARPSIQPERANRGVSQTDGSTGVRKRNRLLNGDQQSRIAHALAQDRGQDARAGGLGSRAVCSRTPGRRLLGQLLERSSHVETDCDRRGDTGHHVRNRFTVVARRRVCRGRRTQEVYRTLTQQAAMTIRELTDLVDANWVHAAITIAAGKAEQGSRGRRMVEARRRLVGYDESMW